MRSAEWIVGTWRSREAHRAPQITTMRKIRDHYSGDLIIPLPEMDTADRPAVANLLMTGVDQTAMRIASCLPSVYYPPVRPAIQASMDKANVRRKATLGWYEANRMGLKLRRRARHLVAYSCAPIMLRPDFTENIPQWNVRDPLTAFPADSGDPDDLRPSDCIFAYKRSAGYVKARWPEKYAQLRRPTTQSEAEMLDIVEYVDDQEWTLVLAGNGQDPEITTPYAGVHQPDGMTGFVHELILEQVVNRAEVCPVVIPGRITLGRLQGQFDQTIPLYMQQARLQALEIIATEKAIFKDAYLVSNPNESAEFIDGPHDGRTGLVSIVKGGKIEYIGGEPNPQTNQSIDRLERNQRIMSGVAAEMGGESQSNVRTGRRGDSILSTQIDPGVAEAQEVMAASLTEENKIAVAIVKKYFGKQPKSFYVSWKGAVGPVDYIPDVVFENDNNTVVYPHAGSDQAALTIGIGQLLGEGLISTHSAQDLHPWISDPEKERDRIQQEQIEKAILSGLEQQIAQGAIPISDAARIGELVVTNKKSLAEAIQLVQKEAQDRQASDQTAPPGSPAAPVDPNSPQAQPGLSLPGAGAEAGTTIQPPAPSQVNLQQMLRSLRQPNQLSPAERAA